ncbi:MAG: hypothetical protein OXT74_17450 [Candidatus Poribacteria bacterium]|nr:hypothetical protein [Candidatus Poribacteria bacterium]
MESHTQRHADHHFSPSVWQRIWKPPYINQILPTNSGAIIAVAYNDGTYISNDRGETWYNPFGERMYPGLKAAFVPDFSFSDAIWSMTEFDGY